MLHGLAEWSWGGGGAACPARQSPRVWLAKAEGPDCVSSDSQRDLISGMLKVNSSARRVGGREDTGRERCQALEDGAQIGREARCWPAPSPSPVPQPKSQREPVPITELACTLQTPSAVLLWIHPSNGLPASLPVLQDSFHRGPPMAKQAKPAPPAPVHLADPPQLIRPWLHPIKAAPQAWQCASIPDRGHTTSH